MVNLKLKEAKANYKQALKNISLYIERRDKMLLQILESRTPKWGSLIIKRINY